VTQLTRRVLILGLYFFLGASPGGSWGIIMPGNAGGAGAPKSVGTGGPPGGGGGGGGPPSIGGGGGGGGPPSIGGGGGGGGPPNPGGIGGGGGAEPPRPGGRGGGGGAFEIDGVREAEVDALARASLRFAISWVRAAIVSSARRNAVSRSAMVLSNSICCCVMAAVCVCRSA
jgi:hypothetical protein